MYPLCDALICVSITSNLFHFGSLLKSLDGEAAKVFDHVWRICVDELCRRAIAYPQITPTEWRNNSRDPCQRCHDRFNSESMNSNQSHIRSHSRDWHNA